MDDNGHLQPKRTSEQKVLTFDFARRMASGESIESASWTCTVHAGTDASASSMVSGSATNSGTKSSQKIISGVDGVTYLIRCALTTSQQTLYGEALLYVSDTVRSGGTVR